MHIPDGFLSFEVGAAAFAVSAAAGAAAFKTSGDGDADRRAPLLGVTSAFVFAAQMINFPVAGGTSGHFVGALFSAVALGPANAVIVMASVITLQCLLFADGGVTALGANIMNMGVIGGLTSYYVFAALKSFAPRNRKWFLASAAVAAWVSVVASSAACALELAFSGISPMQAVLPAMTAVHSVIGVGEAVITASALSIVMAARPDIIASLNFDPQTARPMGAGENP
ncbi:MAG: energy-coupling factor ABC transporter permease [Nitrospinae bacterium]|nr:energy-coupling factor ABC transporter permease [Nitrospinota bacterium]